jgi:DNA mismatch repair protein MutL
VSAPRGPAWPQPSAPSARTWGADGASSSSARDWARTLREQTRASRAAEEPAVYRPGGDGAATDVPRLPSLAEHVRQAIGPGAAVEPGDERVPGPPHASTPHLDGSGLDGNPRGSGAEPLELGTGPSVPPPRLAVGTAPIASQAGGFFSQLRYLGQLDLTYLACEGDGELVLIDQHAAHERVELARLRERHARGGDARVAVQNMLFPVTLDATPVQLALVVRVGALLAQVGFEVEPFGKSTLAVKAVPAGIRHGDPAQLLRRLLQDWVEAGPPSEADLDERLDALLGAIACHSVVRAGDRLTSGEAETLLRSLDGIDPSLPAPHGRAVLLRLPLSEIGRRFGRS